MAEPDDGCTVTQWEVVWFPDDAPERRKRSFDEEVVRKIARREAEHGFAPLVSSRTIVYGDWEVDPTTVAYPTVEPSGG